LPQAQQGPGPAGAECGDRHRILQVGLRLHLLLWRRVGAAGCPDRRRQPAPRRLQIDGNTMADKFRVALSGDFKKADGSPTFPDFDLVPLQSAPGVEVAFLENANPIRADQLADFDALILLIPRFGKESIHPNGRLSVVARFGVGYDNVDVPASTDAGIPLV